jgi:hypothetical protein
MSIRSLKAPYSQVCACMAYLCLAGTPLRADEEEENPARPGHEAEVLELKDPDLIARVWGMVHPESALPPGEFQILLPAVPENAHPEGAPEPVDGGAYLLRNGTTEGRLDRGAWEQAAAFARQDKVVRWREDWEEPESGYIPTLWRSLDVDRERLIRWTAWPSGLGFKAGSAISMVPRSAPQFQRQLDFEWNQTLYRHFLAGAALRRTEFGGGLVRTARNLQVTGIGSDTSFAGFWSEPYWWWSLSAGMPGVRYTLYLADRPVPNHFWLETRASTLIRDRKAGRVVRQWADSSLRPEGNVGQSLDLRLGYLRYKLNWDGDAYESVVQAFELDELPAFFGQWGAGIVSAGDVAATRVWLDFADFAFSLSRPSRYPSRFRFAFLHLDLAYRNLKSFHLGVSLMVRLENPILSFPGASP